MDPVTIINNLLLEEEDDKIAVQKQIREFINANWGTREPPSLSGYEEVFPSAFVKIEPDSDSDEDVSSTQDSLPPSYPLDVKPILVNYQLKEEHAVSGLVVKIRNISKYLVTAEQDLESITEGFSVDLENIKHLVNKSILDDNVPVYDDDKHKYGHVRCKADDDNTLYDDDGYNDDYEVDDDGSYVDDDKDEDYKVEEDQEEEEEEDEEEDYSESDEENLESIYEDYEDDIEDDDWTPHRRNKRCGLVKRKQRHKGTLLKHSRFKGNFDGLAEGFTQRRGNFEKETMLGLLGKPSTETKPEMVECLDNAGDAVILEGRETCNDKSVDLADSSRMTSSTSSKSEKSCENPGPEEESTTVQMTSSEPSVVTDVAKATKSHSSRGIKETKADCEDDSGVEVITIKQVEKNSDRPQEKERKKMVQCSVCDKVYSKQYMTLHTRTHTGERLYKCDICGKAFIKSFSLKTHRQRHSEEKPFKCSVCGKGFHTKSGLKAHNAVHSDKRRFKCQICDKAYKHKVALQKHEKNVHERAGVGICSVCHRKFSSQEAVDRHKRMHLPDQKQECVYCGKQFTVYKSLFMHEWRCSRSKSFQCEICGFSTKLKHTLIVHMRHHTGEKPYMCQHCGKRWASRSYLSSHEKTHSDQRPHKCQFCEKTYRRSSHLRRHEKFHTGEKSYKCRFCHESFFTLDTKVYHEKKKHLGIKHFGGSKIPYRDMPKRHKCSFCDQKFVMTGERNLHERERHTGLKPFSCSICGKKFSRKRNAKSHLLKIHQKVGFVKKVDRETVLETVQPQPERKCRQKCR